MDDSLQNPALWARESEAINRAFARREDEYRLKIADLTAKLAEAIAATRSAEEQRQVEIEAIQQRLRSAEDTASKVDELRSALDLLQNGHEAVQAAHAEVSEKLQQTAGALAAAEAFNARLQSDVDAYRARQDSDLQKISELQSAVSAAQAVETSLKAANLALANRLAESEATVRSLNEATSAEKQRAADTAAEIGRLHAQELEAVRRQAQEAAVTAQTRLQELADAKQRAQQVFDTALQQNQRAFDEASQRHSEEVASLRAELYQLSEASNARIAQHERELEELTASLEAEKNQHAVAVESLLASARRDAELWRAELRDCRAEADAQSKVRAQLQGALEKHQQSNLVLGVETAARAFAVKAMAEETRDLRDRLERAESRRRKTLTKALWRRHLNKQTSPLPSKG